ncbi:tripartite tricarboxylate transporter substrate binding protein [soil metagenome]
MFERRRVMAAMAVAATGIALALQDAHADGGPRDAGGTTSYPSHTVRVISPFSAGGGTDFIARLLSERLGRALGQTVIVENKPGANGVIGSDFVAKAAPDGYTLVLGTVGSHGINAAVYEKMPFDTVRDFSPIGMVARTPMLVLANPQSVKANDARDLLIELKRAPAPLVFSSAGTGSVGHVAGALYSQRTGVELIHAPYKGAAPAVLDLMSGQVQLMFGTPVSTLQYVKAGKIKALAVTSETRSKIVPDIPTLAEQGLPGFDVSTWYGLFAPANTPPAIVDYVSARLREVMADPAVQQQFLDQGLEAVGNTPAEFAAQVRGEVAKYQSLGKSIR